MTIPPQNPFEHNPFGNAPFGSHPTGPPAYSTPPAVPPDRGSANVFATLSVVFAFVFAPIGTVFGHVGLRQIRRTGQRGRDRALIGTVLSYAVIVVAVIALVALAWKPPTNPAHIAAPTTTAPPPAITPADLPGLIPSLDDVKNITGEQTLTIGGVSRQPRPAPETLDRPECRGALDVGVPELYGDGAMLGFYVAMYVEGGGDSFNTVSVGPGVAAFRDGAAARTQLTKFLSLWRQCNGASVKDTWPNKAPFTISVSGPRDIGNGISTVELASEGALNVHAVATRANVVIDLLVSYTGNGVDRARQAAADVANQILNKIPS